MRDILQQRILEIAKAIEQSAANHNALIGRLDEAKFCLTQLDEQNFKESIENHEVLSIPDSE